MLLKTLILTFIALVFCQAAGSSQWTRTERDYPAEVDLETVRIYHANQERNCL